jgi:hypothetical protein
MNMVRTLAIPAVVAALVLLASGCASTPPLMLQMSPEELRQKAEDDLRQVQQYDEALGRTLLYASKHPGLFPKGGVVDMSPEEKDLLRDVWRETLDYMLALDGIKRFWRHFGGINLLARGEDHALGFLVGYTAWVVQYRAGLVFIDLTVPSKPLETLLDEAAPEHDIPKGSFAKLKWNVINLKSVGQLVSGREYLRAVAGPALERGHCRSRPHCTWALDNTVPYVRKARSHLKERGVVDFGYNAFDILRDASFTAWFPVQKVVAEWMGDTKVKRFHAHLIDHEQLHAMRQRMEPGDIIVARHNWYLSNVGLPGFWPHAELYVGAPDELWAYFDDPELDDEFPRLDPHTPGVITHLSTYYPEVWKHYVSGSEDQPYRVIEAISEGVVFSSLEKAAGADYVGVMRPRFRKLDKARAVAKAFELHGRPYDFNFDFLTDEKLVCTELVYKAWQPDQNKNGPDFELSRIVGRTTLPANHMVRHFDQNHEREDRALDFVYFLDGLEGIDGAVVSDLANFRKSWRRPKWDTVQP